jgi:hypothetical protein
MSYFPVWQLSWVHAISSLISQQCSPLHSRNVASGAAMCHGLLPHTMEAQYSITISRSSVTLWCLRGHLSHKRGPAVKATAEPIAIKHVAMSYSRCRIFPPVGSAGSMRYPEACPAQGPPPLHSKMKGADRLYPETPRRMAARSFPITKNRAAMRWKVSESKP